MAVTTSSLANRSFWVGDWRVEPRANVLRQGDEHVHIEPKVMDVLCALAGRAGEPVTRDELMGAVWTDVVVSDDALNRTVSRLRKALGDDPRRPRYIETIPTVGYRLVAPVTVERGGDSQGDAQGGDSATRVLPALELVGLDVRGRPAEEQRAPRHAMVAALLVALLAGLGAGWWLLADAGPTTAPRVTPLTSLPGHELAPAFSPDGTRLAFAWKGETQDNWDIYMRLVDGGARVRLTDDPAREMGPVWSPDGTRIAYLRVDEEGCAIRTLPALGGPSRVVATCAAGALANLDWSPDGRSIVWSERARPGEPYRLSIADPATGEQRVPTAPISGTVGDYHPVFSPDGQRLAFTRSGALGVSDVYVVPVEGGTPRRVTFDDRKVHGVDWTPDGRSLVFASNRSGTYGLWRVSAGGGTPEWLGVHGQDLDDPVTHPGADRIAYEQWTMTIDVARLPLDDAAAAPRSVVEASRWDWRPHVGPTGTRIAFASDRTGSAEIWSAALDGSDLVQHTDFGGPFATNPRWDPSERRIAFDARVHGAHADVYVVDTETGHRTRLTEDASDESMPSWSPDGRWIYFGSNREGTWQVYRMPSSGGEAEPVTRDGGYVSQLSPDGAVLYVTRSDAPGLWALPPGGGTARQVLSDLAPLDAANWAPTDRGIYYVRRTADAQPVLAFWEKATDTVTDVRALPDFIYDSGLTLTPDGGVLYAHVVRNESDLMLLDRE